MPASAQPADAAAPPPAGGFVDIAGSAGLPAFLRAGPGVYADAHGVRGGNVRTVAADFLERDFVLDVVLTFEGTEDRRPPDLVVGIGDNGREGNFVSGTIGVRIKGPSRHGPGVVNFVAGLRNEDAELCKLGTQPGPHLVRLEKKGNALTVSVCVGSNGADLKPTATRTVPDLKSVATSTVKNGNGTLVFGGEGAVRAVRLTVDGKPVGGEASLAARPAADPAGGAADVVDQIPLFSLAGQAGLPAYLKATPATRADENGISATGEIRTVAADFINHDFTFDVVYRSQPGERSIFVIGIGENDRGKSVHSRVHGPGHGGGVTFAIPGQQEQELGKIGDHAGPHLFRLEKRGKTLTMAVAAAFDGKTFTPTFTRTAPDIAAAAPFLTKVNSALFAGAGNGGVIESVRLVVDGKPTPAGTTPAAKASPGDDAPMFGLAGTAGLPAYLKASGPALASETGLLAEELRTVDTALLDKDFTFDLVFRFKDDGERAIFLVGFGGLRREGNWIHDSIYSRVHGPGHGGQCTFAVSGAQENEIGRLPQGTAGPHLFRLQKRGQTLTMAISPNYSGKFEPIASKTLPDLKSAAPFLIKRNAGVFVAGSTTIESVRFWVDGKPVETGKEESAPAVAASPGIDGPEHLIRIKKSLPAFFVKEKDAPFDGNGALALEDRNVRTREANFVSKNFTFDVIYRNHSNAYRPLVVGIGENKWEGNRLNNSVAAVMHGANDGVVGVNISGQPGVEFAKAGRDPGPHLLRMQKAGNTMTFSLTPNFQGKFDPVATRTIPDLKTAAPFLTPRNSVLFIHGHGTVEQVRLMVEGEAVESQDLVLGVPPHAVTGKPMKAKVVKPEDAARLKGKRFVLESGPSGLTLSPAGDLAWTPTPEQVGRHEVKVRVEGGGGKDATLATAYVEVYSAADVAAVKGDLSKVASLYRVPLSSEKFDLVTGLGGTSMLLLQGDELKRLEPDGVTVRSTLKLPKAYERIRERAEYFVALSDPEGEKSLDLLDKRTGKVIRSVSMDYRNRFDLALNPVRPECYVTVEKATADGLRTDIIIVEEKTGDVREPEDFVGRWVKVSADGKVVYAGYKEVYQRGNRLLINPDRIHVVPEYGNIDLLVIYDVSRPVPRVVRVKDDIGANGQGLELSPDERRISYLSFTGYPTYTHHVSAWDPRDLTKRPVTYPTKDNGGDSGKIAFHPVLPIVAAPSDAGAVAFDRETGKVQPDRLGRPGASLLPDGGKAKAVWFSADGRNALIHCEDGQSGTHALLRAKLKLTPQEETKLGKPDRPAATPPAPPAKKPLKRPASGSDV